MRLVRTIAFAVAILALGAGYIASQVNYAQGQQQAADYAAWVDRPEIQALTLLLLILCIVLPFLPDQKGKGGRD
jgi:hypothetical protein